MERERNSECWYSEVCNMDNPCDSCIRYIEMKYLMDNSGLPKTKQRPIELSPDRCDLDSFYTLQHYKDTITEFVNNGESLYIGGGTGNGKTSWAIKLLLKYFDEIWAGNGFRVRGMFVHVPSLLLQLKDFNNPLAINFKDNLINADLVVFDEIGGVGMSNYDYSQLLNLVDTRIVKGLSNIYTSNLANYNDCKELLGERLASRVFNSSHVVVLKGKDRR